MNLQEHRRGAGYAVYTPGVLALYDIFVIMLSNRFIWQCPPNRIQDMYSRYGTINHLEAGPGTGFFLNRCRFPAGIVRLGLLDANPHCLRAAARRLDRYSPVTYCADIMKPLDIATAGFDSVGLNYVLHCLPGPMPAKAVALSNLKQLMNRGGVLFGSTLLHCGVRRSLPARCLMSLYNRCGIFANAQDDLEGLRCILRQHFSESGVETAGCAAVFWGRR